VYTQRERLANQRSACRPSSRFIRLSPPVKQPVLLR